ncbi:MAG: ATP synthase F1 subunit gamma [Candidatus Magasanikbacteria bacterium RIFCSPHIGHO2_02_FULL_51_14]|uniref:ATP synthase gamma chain n=1 Tax=Candidatus Magasanikbacteria bacterium RIFCSPHIGHO2_02_FULL_51_14 TaxID=1798683 RepID=A0A1F6MEN5_9BACT|nr:MAG: ATP synthase F1 subunit gamma [Candidatus Magasanikbacteria bacterium RIFCSPHIGHO2_02_FULL_51_14]
MPVNTKAIKRRIKSVSNTKKITKAMELVSAAKMRRAVEAAINTRMYAQLAWELLVNLSKTQKETLPLLEIRPVKKLLLILITSNRGLCGSFNSNIIKKATRELKDPRTIGRHRTVGGEVVEPAENIVVDVIGVGKKGAVFVKKMGYTMSAAFTDISDKPKASDVLPLTNMAIVGYEKGEYDKVVVGYTYFKSSLVQEAKLRQVLPVSEHDLEKMIIELKPMHGVETKDTRYKIQDTNKEQNEVFTDYLFEPNQSQVLETILPRLVESQIYQSLLESLASEHSARMLAMRNASDAAEEMIDELTLTFNKARQAGITQEISEIVGGAAALA